MQANSLSKLGSFDYFTDVFEDLSIRFSPRFLTYTPHHQVFIETKNYVLKTATTQTELLNVFRLRYQSFLENVKGDDEIYDLDEFDHLCDHLIIKSKEDDTVVGTYRLLCSLYTGTFYSEGEFDLDQFLAGDDVKLELGRACIDPYHRNGNVIDLLWKGIAEYSKVTGAKYLFGCSSIKTIAPQAAYGLYQYLKEEGMYENSYDIRPTEEYEMDFSDCHGNIASDVKKMLPSLLRSYLSAGAKVQGLPAIDKEFACIDFLTILDLDQISKSYKRRYFS